MTAKLATAMQMRLSRFTGQDIVTSLVIGFVCTTVDREIFTVKNFSPVA